MGRTVAAVLAAALILSTTVFADELSGLFTGFLTRNASTAEYVREFVFEDLDEHVKMQVVELLSDEVSVQMVVRYEALDEAWLDRIENLGYEDLYLFPSGHTASLSISCIPLEEYSEDNARYYYVATTYSHWDPCMGTGELTYPMSDGAHTVVLDTSCNVPVYEYELRAGDGEAFSRYNEPAYLRISRLSYVIYGNSQGLFRDGRSGSITLTSEELKQEIVDMVCFVREDGAELPVEWDLACGDLTKEQQAGLTQYNCVVASGSFRDPGPDFGGGAGEINPPDIAGVRLSNGSGAVYYEMVRPYQTIK